MTDHRRYFIFSHFEEYSLNKPQVEITLLKSFISDKNCDSIQGVFYASAFLCKIEKTNDTIIVLNICRRPDEFLKREYEGPKGFRIDSSSVHNSHPERVFATIDESILARKYKYLIADIRNYLED